VLWRTDADSATRENLFETTLRRLSMAISYATRVGELAPLYAPSGGYTENIRADAGAINASTPAAMTRQWAREKSVRTLA
jgi:hypothetical protein